jgi:hypothetical protein
VADVLDINADVVNVVAETVKTTHGGNAGVDGRFRVNHQGHELHRQDEEEEQQRRSTVDPVEGKLVTGGLNHFLSSLFVELALRALFAIKGHGVTADP